MRPKGKTYPVKDWVRRTSKYVGKRGVAFMINRWRKDESTDRR